MAKVPAASWVSFMVCCFLFASSFRDAPLGAGPESITPIAVMDSGLSLARPGMTAFVSKSPRRFFDRIFREENLGSVLDDILGPPSLARRLPAVHFHHPHFAHPARARNAEHLAGLV